MVDPVVNVLTLSEDGATEAVEVIQTVVRRLLVHVVEPGARSQYLRFEPYAAEHRPAVVANAWLSTSPRDQEKITKLNRYIARVLDSGGTFRLAVHHFDADRPWSPARPSAKLQRWQQVVAAPVAKLTRSVAASERLVPVVPHPELEGWLYLASEALEELAASSGRQPPQPPADGWDSCTAIKDEHSWPRDMHNLLLAKRLPAERAVRSSPSLADTAERLKLVPGLIEALRSTVAGPLAPRRPPA